MLNMNMLYITEQRNFILFREAIENFIQTELKKIGFAQSEPEGQTP